HAALPIMAAPRAPLSPLSGPPYGRPTGCNGEAPQGTSPRHGRVPEWFRDSPAKRVTRVRFPPRPLARRRTGRSSPRRGPSRPAAPAHGAVSQPSPFTNEPMPGVVTSSPSARTAATALRAVILATPPSPWLRDSLVRVSRGYL